MVADTWEEHCVSGIGPVSACFPFGFGETDEPKKWDGVFSIRMRHGYRYRMEVSIATLASAGGFAQSNTWAKVRDLHDATVSWR